MKSIAGLASFAVIVLAVIVVLSISRYSMDFRDRCFERGGAVVKIGGGGRDVCLGPDLKILEVSYW